MTIGIVGDHDPGNVTYTATDTAFARLGAEARWIPTPSVEADPSALAAFDGLMISPGRPLSERGRRARRHPRPRKRRPAARDVRRVPAHTGGVRTRRPADRRRRPRRG